MPRLSAFLKDEITRRDWSVEDLARRADLSTSLMYQIVRDGKDNVRQDTLARLAAALSMSPAELQAAADGNTDSDPDEIALLAYSREMSPAKRDTLLELAAAMRRNHPPTHARRRRDSHTRQYDAEHRKLTRPDDDESPEPPNSRYSEYYPRVDEEIAGIMAGLAPLSRRAAVALPTRDKVA